MEERLQKLLSAAGLCSRRAAEGYITAGRVTVNGETAELGRRADPDRDDIRVDGKPLSPQAEPVYLLLNKPRGYVTTLSDEQGRRTVADLVKDCGARVYPVGRLDLDSEGLLLMTNDGALMQPAAASQPRGLQDLPSLRLRPGGRSGGTAGRRHRPGGGGHPPRPGGGAAADSPDGGARHHDPRGEEPPDPPDVRRLRPDGKAAAPGAGAYPGAGRSALRKVAAADGTGNGGIKKSGIRS